MSKYAFKALFDKLNLSTNTQTYVSSATYEAVIYEELSQVLVFKLHNEVLIPLTAYEEVIHSLRLYTKAKVDLQLLITNHDYKLYDLKQYLNYAISLNPNLKIFDQPYFKYETNKLIFKFHNSASANQAKNNILNLKDALSRYNLKLEIEVEEVVYKEVAPVNIKKDVTKVVAQPNNQNTNYQANNSYQANNNYQNSGNDYSKFNKKRPKQNLEQYVNFNIEEIVEECSGISFEAEVFEIEERTLRTGKIIQTLYLKDKTSAITAKRFERNNLTKEVLQEVKVGDYLKVYGKIESDLYSKELVVSPDVVEKKEKEKRSDNSELKRIEFHVHTKYSEMDGVSSVAEYINQASKWGMDAIAITDHNVVQSFPKAQSAMSKVNKGREKPFKVIYGCEMTIVDPILKIVKNGNDQSLESLDYCVLDIETTGLSNTFDHIIEFGGAHISNMALSDNKLQMFINTPLPISPFTTKLTTISQHDVDNGLSIKTALQQIVEFIGNRVIIAHNASFDMDFLNAVLENNGMARLTNPVIDTLDLSRAIRTNKRYHSLGVVARSYGVAYDKDGAHRADYDTEVLAQVFLKILKNELPEGMSLNELNALGNFEYLNHNYGQHLVVLAKNAQGLKELFQLISLSHTKYLSYFDKGANANVSGQPRMIKSVLADYHQNGNLLFGTSCYAGEIYDIASTKTKREVKAALAFYDYVEIQPIECYRHLMQEAEGGSYERVVNTLKLIYECARELDKLIIASGDAHYVDYEQQQIRDIYINSQAIGGIRHPMYVKDQQRRKEFESVKQHFRTTEEMLVEYPYLSDSETYELVVTNTNKLNEKIEFVYPVKDKLYPPEIEGCDQLLREICYKTAHETYGEVLPEIVTERLERELNSIIGNGFHVVYYISHLLVKKSLDDGYLVGSRGSVGSSFVATMANITEVNPLAPHYACPKCHYTQFYTNGEVASGFDLPTIKCPGCGLEIRGDGQDIPFETFLGFEGDKVPDIDLNFSGEYQEVAHNYTKEVFGEDYVYRAGTIGTVARQTAFGYVKGYQEEMEITKAINSAQMLRLTQGCEGVKRTTGQHPGGIIVIPDYMDVHDFTPYQFPANNPKAEWRTTHFEFHDIHDNVLKLDILGHVDPTAMKLLEKMSGIDPKTIPINDPKVMSIFSSIDALAMDTSKSMEKTGAAGIPEFGTQFVRGILELTKPTTFDELVRISGLSHGTDVWLNNAKDLIDAKICTLKEVIGCRDDIMVYLMHKGLPPKTAFDIMEFVRKGKGLKPEWIEIMKQYNVDDWYINSCEKIKYMFPKAHAVAYVLMAVRIAWFKVYYPNYYYAVYFSIRCDAYDIDAMIAGESAIRQRMSEIRQKMESAEFKNQITKKDKDVYSTLELALEMNLRGLRFGNINLAKSDASLFIVDKDNPNVIIPPFSAIDGLGEAVGVSIMEARNKKDENGRTQPFISKEDLLRRTSLSKTHLSRFEQLKVVEDLDDKNQMSLF